VCLSLPNLSNLRLALECYTCNTDSVGGICEFDPESAGLTAICNDRFDHCYTRREEDENSLRRNFGTSCDQVQYFLSSNFGSRLLSRSNGRSHLPSRTGVPGG